ncbi:hypothetical protein VNI00_017336 [Paramarasmius palmivorus]|uniref:Uncharacterized protein n=1 Tax=Paramarasmius palmivorus TaxID=297713 RepID=A0AAW0B6X7_9AGAR
MIWSGGMMKYPFSVINNLINQFGEDLGIAYNIMCAFLKMLEHSPKLKEKVAKNQFCQLWFHPQYFEGVGLEDFEECKQTFSLSNVLASTTQLTTEFYRCQAIQEHNRFHDEDKHAALGNLLHQNYRQAFGRLVTDVPLLEELCYQHEIQPEDCEEFLTAECEHFNADFEEPPKCVVGFGLC